MTEKMKALVFDTETTGIPKHPNSKMSVQPRIIEFGGLLIDEDGVELEELSLIINPQMEIEPIITKITGLTNDDLRDKPLFVDVYSEIAAMFEKADCLIAHNLPFDSTMIQLELQRNSIRNIDFPWPIFNCCTVQLNMPEYGYRPKLTELYEEVIGKKLEQTHRATDDCRALVEIVIKEKYLEKIRKFNSAAKSSL